MINIINKNELPQRINIDRLNALIIMIIIIIANELFSMINVPTANVSGITTNIVCMNALIIMINILKENELFKKINIVSLNELIIQISIEIWNELNQATNIIELEWINGYDKHRCLEWITGSDKHMPQEWINDRDKHMYLEWLTTKIRKENQMPKVKALSLTRDFSLYPRAMVNEICITNVNKLCEALRAGIKLPPIIVDKISKRVIDGFHRIAAYLKVFGDDAVIDVIYRQYKTDKEMFIEAVKLNSSQGLKLSPKDMVHVLIVSGEMGIPVPDIAKAIGMTEAKALDFIKNRTATTKDNEVIPLAGGSMGLAGKKLTVSQEKYAKTASGVIPIVHARILLNALRADALVLEPREIEVLKELQKEITIALA